MTTQRRNLLLAALAAPLIPRSALAQSQAPKLFPDSRLVEKDRISVEVVGTGPDLVFIPGMISSREVWRPTAERLKRRYRLHLVQLAGFAGEPARANAKGPVWTPTAEAIDAYIVEQKIAPATVIGHSLGGTMTLYLAQKHPDHVKKGLLVDATPFLAETFGMPPAAVAQMRQAIATGRVQAFDSRQLGGFANMAGKPADQAMIERAAKASDPIASGWFYVEDLALDLSPGLAGMKTPLTMVFPDNVPTGAPAGATRANYDKAYKDFGPKTFVEIKDSRHFVMQDQPEAFAKALDTFLAS